VTRGCADSPVHGSLAPLAGGLAPGPRRCVPPLRQCILLLGPPGAGLDRLARIVQRLGCAPAEEAGAALADFSARLLAQGDRAPLDPKPLPAAATDPRLLAECAAHAAELLADALPERRPLMLADPALARLAPLWPEIARRARVTLKILLVTDEPARLGRARQLCEEDPLLWLAHLLPAEAASRPLPRAILDHAALREDWRAALTAACAQIELRLPDLMHPRMVEVDAWFTADAPGRPEPPPAAPNPLPDLTPLAEALHQALRSAPPEEALDPEPWDKARDAWQLAWAEASPGEGASPLAPPHRPPARFALPAPALPPRGVPLRHVILHYHLFKNAGTSLDHALRGHFGRAWMESEGGERGWRAPQIAALIAAHPGLKVLSSHTALLPPPRLPGVVIHPLLFLRHPLDRVRSIHDFERGQASVTEGSLLARNTDLPGYIRARLDRAGDRSIRDFQVHRLARTFPPTDGSEAERALRALDVLPHVGLVERYNDSLLRFEAGLAEDFPGITLLPTQANRTQRPGLSLEQRLAAMRADIGGELYGRLEDANAQDIALHQEALRRLEAALAAPELQAP